MEVQLQLQQSTITIILTLTHQRATDEQRVINYLH